MKQFPFMFTPLNQLNTPHTIEPTQHPMKLFTGSMEHAQRTLLSQNAHRTS